MIRCGQFKRTDHKRGEETMKAREMFTGDSFGWNCPENFQEICDALNSIAEEELGDEEDEDIRREIINSIWERFCSGKLAGVPEGHHYNDDGDDETAPAVGGAW
jgi:hypothetical protein